MKKILLVLGIFFLLISFCYSGDVWVNGYYRKDGTYVAPYYRSSPNDTVRDNYSYKGNVNPYTGEVGHNYYRNNPTSEYYQPNYQPQQQYNYKQQLPTYNYNPPQYNSNNSYIYTQPRSTYQYNTGQTQTIYSNGQYYKVTPQSDDSLIIEDSYGNTYRYDSEE